MMPIYGVCDSALYGLGLDRTIDSAYLKFCVPTYQMSSGLPGYHLLIAPKKRGDIHYRFKVLRNGNDVDLRSSEKFNWIWNDYNTYEADSCQ